MTIKSDRLLICKAAESDCSIIYALWTDPRVMANVGFPEGLRITKQEIKDQISNGEGVDSLFDSLLIVDLRSNGVSIGQCMMHGPNDEGISTTDIKLLPRYWGNGFGVEIKMCLINSLFALTDCLAVDATPNVNNLASIKMQESVGGVKIGEKLYEFPESMADFTAPVHHYIYRVTRSAWEGASSGMGSSEARSSSSQC